MSIKKVIIKSGDGERLVKKYDEVVIEYTGWIQDKDEPEEKGTQFDTSVGRGDTVAVIGAGRLLKGWDQGVLGEHTLSDSDQPAKPMALNEKARFELPPEFGYGRNGFPGQVPKNATLIYELELKKIGPQRAP